MSSRVDDINVMKAIQDRYSSLSKGQKRIAEFVNSNYEKAAFMTAAKLGEYAGVSESTVVRFANAIGFDGYPMLQGSLQGLIKNKLTTVQRMEMTDKDYDTKNSIKDILKTDVENIKYAMDHIDYEALEETRQLILSAKKVYIVALRSSITLAQYLGFYLGYMLDNVVIITAGISDVLEQIVRVGPEDVVIGISYPRYSQKTIDSLCIAKGKGAKIIALTDSHLSPISSIADKTLVAQSTMVSFIDSLVVPMSLINVLVFMVSLERKDVLTKSLNELETVWDTYKVYNVRKDDNTRQIG